MTSMDATKHTRRNFLKMLGAATCSMALPQMVSGRRQSSRRPNVVLIFTDDQGSIDVNCYGAKDLYTENLDRLAAEGDALHAVLRRGAGLLAFAGGADDRALSAPCRPARQRTFA